MEIISLHELVESGTHYSRVKTKLEQGADINGQNFHGQTPLHIACREGAIVIINLLLDHNADTHIKDNDDMIADIDRVFKNCPLLVKFACENNVNACIDLLLEDASVVNVQNLGCGKTALHVACLRGNMPIIELLSHYNADFNIKDRYDYSTLFYACASDNPGVVNYLLEHNVDPNIKHNEIPMVYHVIALGDSVVGFGDEINLQILRILLANNIDLDHLNYMYIDDFEQHTAISKAAELNDLEAIELLIKSGATNIYYGLFEAAEHGNMAIAKCLIKADVDINMRDKRDEWCPGGGTALHIAAAFHQDKLTRLFLDNGANVRAADANGCTALHACLPTPFSKEGDEAKTIEIIHMLIDAGIDIDVRDELNRTALFFAVYRACDDIESKDVECENVVRTLLKLGANINHQCWINDDDKELKKTNTPMLIAKDCSNITILNMLENI